MIGIPQIDRIAGRCKAYLAVRTGNYTMTSNSQRAEIHSSLFVSPRDDVKMRFYRAAVLPRWPGRTDAAVSIAVWLIENMSWESGVVIQHTSARHLMALTGLSRAAVDDGIAALVGAGLIERTYLGKGKRGAIKVSERVSKMPIGTLVTDLWPDLKVACISGRSTPKSGLDVGPVDDVSSGLDVRPVSGLDVRPQWPAIQADYPIPLPEDIPAAAGSSNADPTLPPMTSMHATLKLNQPESPRARVAGATDIRVAHADVAPAPDHYGYGTEIAGLNGHTSEVVDRLVKLQSGNIVDKTPTWTVVMRVSRETSPDRVRAVIPDLEAAHVAGRLRLPVLRALKGFAANITEAEAQERLEAASKPKRFILKDYLQGSR